jgi:RNA polymerase sigma-70 factor, ECF subfamily
MGNGGIDESERARRFEQLYSTHFPKVMAFARRRVRADVAKEVVEETFVIAWRNLDTLEGDPLPWLYRVALRSIAHAQRGSARQSRLHEKLIATWNAAWPNGTSDSEAGESMRAALAHLGDRDREVLQLTYWEGMSLRESAQVLGCSESAAKVRLHRARNRLRQLVNADDTTSRYRDSQSGPIDFRDSLRVLPAAASDTPREPA